MKRLIFICCYADIIPRHRLMCKTLSRDGHEIIVISWNRNWPRDRAIPDEWVSEWHNIPLRAGAGSATLLWKLPSLLRQIIMAIRRVGRVDTIFMTHFCLLPAAPILAGLCGKLYYDAPEYFCEDMLRYFGRLGWLARPFVRRLERLWLARVVAITTIDSRDGWLEEYYRCMRRPVLALWNTPSRDDEPDAAEIAAAASELGSARIVAYAGALKRIKGLDVALGAIPAVRDRFPDVRFLFIGPLQEKQEYIDRLRHDLGIGDVTIFRAQMPYRRLQAYLRASFIGLAILQKERNHLAGEGNCRKIFTYMQAGLPIVVSDVGSIGAFVRDHGFGISIDGEDSAQAAGAICSYLENPDLRRQHAQAGRRAYLDRFNWEQQAGTFTHFINGPDHA